MQSLSTVTEYQISDAATVAAAVPPTSPIVLDQPGTGWLVSSGHIDLFLVHVRNGEPVGHRRHVIRAIAGEFISGLGCTEAGMAMIARPAPETVLRQITHEDLVATEEGVCQLELWLEKLGDAFVYELPPSPHEQLEPWSQTRVEGESAQVAVSASGLVWIRVLKGSSHLLGLSQFRVPPDTSCPRVSYPVPRRAWV